MPYIAASVVLKFAVAIVVLFLVMIFAVVVVEIGVCLGLELYFDRQKARRSKDIYLMRMLDKEKDNENADS